MSQNNVKITVAGPVGSGKSAICSLIEKMLKEHGVPVEWTQADEERGLRGGNWWEAEDLKLYQPTVQIAEVNPHINVDPALNVPRLMYGVIWQHVEKGRGERIDGCSVHITEEVAEKYIKDHWGSLPSGEPLRLYSRPYFGPLVIEVSQSVYEAVLEQRTIRFMTIHGFEKLKTHQM